MEAWTHCYESGVIGCYSDRADELKDEIQSLGGCALESNGGYVYCALAVGCPHDDSGLCCDAPECLEASMAVVDAAVAELAEAGYDSTEE